MEEFSLCHLRLIQTLVIMPLHVIQHGVLWLKSLNKHLPLLSFSACPACHLLQHLIGVLITAEIGLIKQGIRAKYRHQRYFIEMQPFGYHLRTDKDIHLVVCHSIDNLPISVLIARGIKVHTHHPSIGKEFLHLLFQPLGTEPLHAHLASAGGALRGDRGMVAAVVATHLLQAYMECERHIAVYAARRLSADRALKQRRIATAVLEKDHLLVVRQCLLHTRHQRIAEMVVHLLTMVLPFEVNKGYPRQLQSGITLREAHQPILTGHRIVVGLHRRRSRAEQHLRPLPSRQHHRHTAGMVARSRILLFITRLMLFVHHHQPEVFQRKKDCRTRP